MPRASLAWREWDGEFVVLDLRGGDIHLLGSLAGNVLLELAAGDSPRTAGDLACRLEVPDVETVDLISAIEQVLENFQRLGLARPERR